MNVEEKERLIKKDIRSIENRVRSAFNQGYEMGVKESRSKIPNTCGDAISRKYILDLIATKGANLDDDLLIVEQWIQDAPSVNPHPIECGDAISRQAVIDILDDMVKNYVNENDFDKAQGIAWVKVQRLPSVTPQQRTGRWIDSHIPESTLCECSECGFTCGAYSFNYCPDCGAKMEVEE